MKRAIKLHELDNVATALQSVDMGECVDVVLNGVIVQHVIVNDAINKYFKFALEDLDENTEAIKYGEVIGKTNCKRHVGDLVHVDELRSVKV